MSEEIPIGPGRPCWACGEDYGQHDKGCIFARLLPPSDTERDLNRKPALMLAFAGVKAGDKIADYGTGSGYFTRLFSSVVGNGGHVYGTALMPDEKQAIVEYMKTF